MEVSHSPVGVDASRARGVKVTRQTYEELRNTVDLMAYLIREGRHDTELTKHAGLALIAAGRPATIAGQVQAIGDDFRRRTVYGGDPVGTERIASAAVTLCLPGAKACLPVRDCDDGVVCVGSELMAIGIPIQIVTQDFGPGLQPHVLLVFYDERGEWVYFDPGGSTEASDPVTGMKVGEAFRAVKEERIDPMDPIPGLGLPAAGPELVGVGRSPAMAILRAEQEQAMAKVFTGFGAGEAISGVGYDAATFQVRTALEGLRSATAFLNAALQNASDTRSAIRGDNYFDPDPPTGPITQLSDFPTDGTWTFSMAQLAEDLYRKCAAATKQLEESLAGTRKIFLSPDSLAILTAGASLVPGGGILIEALPSDTSRLIEVVQGVKDTIVGVYDGSGNLKEGFTRAGERLNAQAMNSLVVGRGVGVQGTGAGAVPVPVIIAGAVVATVVVISIAVTLIMKKQAEAAIVIAQNVTTQTLSGAVARGDMTAEAALKLKVATDKGSVDYQEAANAGGLASGISEVGSTAVKVVVGLTIAAVVGTGLYLLAPLAKDAIAGLRHKRKAAA